MREPGYYFMHTPGNDLESVAGPTRHDARIRAIAEEQAIAVKLRRYFLVGRHRGREPFTNLYCNLIGATTARALRLRQSAPR